MAEQAKFDRRAGTTFILPIIVIVFVSTTALTFFVAPTEATMGNIQRIVYLHVSVAWCGLASAVVMGCFSIAYLGSRQLGWDHWSQAAAEVGCLCSTLTLVTGSVWAHEAWGTWWTWEPRLTSSLLLWIIYAGNLLVRASIDDPHRRARLGGVLSIVGMCDVPLVLMATRWFRGVHPVAPEMDTRMRLVLLASLVCFTTLFLFLIIQRRSQLQRSEQVAQYEANAWNAHACQSI